MLVVFKSLTIVTDAAGIACENHQTIKCRSILYLILKKQFFYCLAVSKKVRPCYSITVAFVDSIAVE